MKERKIENTFSYKNKGSEGIVTHESGHNKCPGVETV